ncbi:MAG: diguanylate cyclase [Actinomycetota bacterium]
MTTRRAPIGLLVGAAGLVIGVVGVAFQQAWLAIAAGALALLAGGWSLLVGREADAGAEALRLAEDELRTAREQLATLEAKAEAAKVAPADLVGKTPEEKKPKPLPPPRVSGPAHKPAVAEFIDAGADDGDTRDGLIDRDTGLFSESFYMVALDGRIAAARRHLRPVAMVLLEVVTGLPGEPDPAEAELVADSIKATLREADTACRLQNGYFALLLEDTPENGAIWTVERIRRKLLTDHDGLTIWAGVACYPAHAFSPTELMDAAQEALVAAREWRQDRIEVATAAE